MNDCSSANCKEIAEIKCRCEANETFYCKNHGLAHATIALCRSSSLLGNEDDPEKQILFNTLLQSNLSIESAQSNIQKEIAEVHDIFIQGEKNIEKNFGLALRESLEFISQSWDCSKGSTSDPSILAEKCSNFLVLNDKKLQAIKNAFNLSLFSSILKILSLGSDKENAYINLLNEICRNRAEINLQMNEILRLTSEIQDIEHSLKCREEEISTQNIKINHLSGLINNIFDQCLQAKTGNFTETPIQVSNQEQPDEAIPYSKPSLLYFFKDDSKTLVIFDFAKSAFTTKELAIDNNIGRLGVICPMAEDKILFHGGWFDSLSDCYIFDTSSCEMQSRSQFHRSYISASAYYKGEVYMFGGSEDGSTCTSFAASYNISKNSWESLQSMPVPSFFNSAVVRGEEILIVGYQLTQCLAYETRKNRYNSALEGLEIAPKMVCTYEESVYVIGTDSVYESHNSGEWVKHKQEQDTLPMGWGFIGYACNHGEYIYFLYNDYRIRRLNTTTNAVETLGIIKELSQ